MKTNWISRKSPCCCGAKAQTYLMEEQTQAVIAIIPNEDNVNLLRAAPDMLAALMQALPIIDVYWRATNGAGDMTSEVVRAAIAKAKGR